MLNQLKRIEKLRKNVIRLLLLQLLKAIFLWIYTQFTLIRKGKAEISHVVKYLDLSQQHISVLISDVVGDAVQVSLETIKWDVYLF